MTIKMLTNNDISFRKLCYRCLRPVKACFCEHITPFFTETRFVILMHPKEAKLAHIGTGRMARVALENSEIIIGENFDGVARVQAYLNDPAWFPMVLYPGENALDVSSERTTLDFEGKKPLLFIIDGTWPCAKSMFRDSKSLHSLPRLSFSHAKVSRYKIRHQPAKFCLSTIESIYQVISGMEDRGVEKVGVAKECLLDSLDRMVEFQIKCSLDPELQRYSRKRGSYKKPEERVSAKRWEHRKICFEDRHYREQKDHL